MLLQIDHRESHDVDIFLPDPQFLSFLNPDVRHFEFELMPSDHSGDGSRFAKFFFKDIGEIDFIVAQSLTGNPTVARKIEGIEILLDTVPEIIAKRVVFRGGYIKPRDIFDIAAAGRLHRHFPHRRTTVSCAIAGAGPRPRPLVEHRIAIPCICSPTPSRG